MNSEHLDKTVGLGKANWSLLSTLKGLSERESACWGIFHDWAKWKEYSVKEKKKKKVASEEKGTQLAVSDTQKRDLLPHKLRVLRDNAPAEGIMDG